MRIDRPYANFLYVYCFQSELCSVYNYVGIYVPAQVKLIRKFFAPQNMICVDKVPSMAIIDGE